MADVRVRDHNHLVPAELAMRTLKASQFDLSQQIAYSGDRVEKFIHLPVIALVMAAEGVRRSQGGGGSLFDPLGQLIAGAWHGTSAAYHHARGNEEAANESSAKFHDSVSSERFADNLSSMVDFENKVRFEDPITGGMLLGEDGVLNETLGLQDTVVQEDPTWAQKGLAGFVGALQGLTLPVAGWGAGRSGAKATQRQATKTASEIAEDVGRYADEAATTRFAGTPEQRRLAEYEQQLDWGSSTPSWKPDTETVPTSGSYVTNQGDVPYSRSRQFMDLTPKQRIQYENALENLRRGGTSRYQGRRLKEAGTGRDVRAQRGGEFEPYSSINDPRLRADVADLNIPRNRTILDEHGIVREIDQRTLPGIDSGEGIVARRRLTDASGAPIRQRGARRTRFGEKYGFKGKHGGKRTLGWKGGLAALGLGALGAKKVWDTITGGPGDPDGPGGGGVGLGDGYGTGSSALGAGGVAGAHGGVGLGVPQGMYSGHGGANVGASIGGGVGLGGMPHGPMGDIPLSSSSRTAHQDIWSGEMERLLGSGYTGTSPIKAGEKMKIGERMLKQAEERMYKAVCPTCGKANCNCKEYKNKEEKMNEKDSKKPAHGMVIVIGSKAGPGPSKEGKRQKLDSEKKDE